MTTTTHEYRLKVRAGGKTYSLDFRRAFVFAYLLTRTRKFKEALPVFEALTRSNGHDPSATIMLAYCRAVLKDFTGSRELLDTVFSEDVKERADQLHTAFVYLSVGMVADAGAELVVLAQECPNLPVICLLVGDLLVSQRRQAKGIACWKLAVARDRDDGAITATVKRLSSPQGKRHEKT